MHFIVLADSDVRSVRCTLASLRRFEDNGAAITLILRKNEASRFLPETIDPQLPSGIATLWLPSHGSLHRAAKLTALEAKADISVMVREGIVLSGGFQDALTETLADGGNAVIWALSKNRSVNQLSSDDLGSSDPWTLLRRSLEADPESRILQARCIRPCVLGIRTEDLKLADFERFSSLPDWYAYRLFARRGAQSLAFVDELSPYVGYIGAYPDRRKPSEQGETLARRLYNIRRGYQMLSDDVDRDFRTLINVQMRNLLRPSHSAQAGAFLRGLLSETFRETKLREKYFIDGLN